MLKSVLLYTGAFALVGVAYGVVKTGIAGDGISIDFGLVATMAVTGAIGGYVAWRRSRR